jgi:hypothetical protein
MRSPTNSVRSKELESYAVTESGPPQLNTYLQGICEGADSEGKIEARKLVRAHLLDEFCSSGKFRLLSLPGARWRFETDLKVHFAQNQIATRFEVVAFERNTTVLHAARPYMIRARGREPGWATFSFPDRRIDYALTNRSCCAHMDVNDFLHLKDALEANGKQAVACRTVFQRWTAVWLDYTSQICAPIESALPRLGSGLSRVADKVPVAVTVMASREDPEITARMQALRMSRADYIAFLLDRSEKHTFRATKEHTYASESNGRPVPMLTVFGVFELKPAYRHVSNEVPSPLATVTEASPPASLPSESQDLNVGMFDPDSGVFHMPDD